MDAAISHGNASVFVDLHAHPSLPFLGAAWRRKMQGFRIGTFDGQTSEDDGVPQTTDAVPPRIYGAACYVTYLLRPDAARKRVLACLDEYRRLITADAPASLILSSADLDPARRPPEAFFLAVESLRCFRDPGDIRRLWDLGVRSLQPIHFLETAWGGSSREGALPPSRGGLTSLGREMLGEMAKLGMLLDLAHMNRKTAEDCLAAYPGPILCSHTGLAELRPTARNLRAALAKEIFRRGGIVGVTVWRHLLGPDPDTPSEKPRGDARAAWTRAFCATVGAFAELAPEGRERVAVGSDRGAPIRAPAWFFSPEHVREIAAGLSAYGWNEASVAGFLGGNAVGFLRRSLPAGRP